MTSDPRPQAACTPPARDAVMAAEEELRQSRARGKAFLRRPPPGSRRCS